MPYNPFGNLGYPTNIQPGTNGFSGISEVSSIDEVKAASVPYGTAIFMANSSDMFYAKNSQGLIKAFKFQEIPIPSNDPQDFITRNEFETLRRQNEQLIEQNAALAAQLQQQQPQPYANVAATQYDPTASTGGVVQPNSANGMDQGTGEPIP